MSSPPSGWPSEVPFPPEERSEIYENVSKSYDEYNINWKVTFMNKESFSFSTPNPDKIKEMPPVDDPSPSQASTHEKGFEEFYNSKPAQHSECPRSRYPKYNDGKPPCTINSTRNLGGGTPPNYRYFCNICEFEWQEERIQPFSNKKRIREERDIRITNPDWKRKLNITDGKSKHMNKPHKCGACYKKFGVYAWKKDVGSLKHICLKRSDNLSEIDIKTWKANEEKTQQEKERVEKNSLESNIIFLKHIIPKFEILSIQDIDQRAFSLSTLPCIGEIFVSLNTISVMFPRITPQTVCGNKFNPAAFRITYKKNNIECQVTVLIYNDIDHVSTNTSVRKWKICSLEEEALQLIYDQMQIPMPSTSLL